MHSSDSNFWLQKCMSSVGDVSSTLCAQLAVEPMSTTELIKTQLAQYLTEIQQWQMSLCQSSSTGAAVQWALVLSSVVALVEVSHYGSGNRTIHALEQTCDDSQGFDKCTRVCFRYAAYTYSCMPQQYAKSGRNARVFQVKSASAST